MAESKKWLLLTTAPDQLTAEIWTNILVQEGIPAMVNPEDTISFSHWRMTFMGVSGFPCRVMLAAGSHQQAQEILDSLQPEPGETAEE